MLRTIDFVFALCGIILGWPIFVMIYLISFKETSSPIFAQQRVGQAQRPFILYKFRTMDLNTASVATHEVDVNSITPFGRFLRKTKLDELPQLWNVLKGDMSLVGPRPCLYNQKELIIARETLDVFSVRPGITGLAQVNCIDMSMPERLAVVDKQMIDSLNLIDYFKYILQTITGKGSGDRTQPK